MNNKERFYAVVSVVFVATIAYFSMATKTIEKDNYVYETKEVPVYLTDTLTVTTVDTVFKYHNPDVDMLELDKLDVDKKRILLTKSQPDEFADLIRNDLPFDAVFEFWRDELGACGVFKWRGELYLTLYKEESIEACDVTFKN